MNHIDEILKTLDPADRIVDPHGPRARADLQRILATDRDATNPDATDRDATDRPVAPVVPADAFRRRRAITRVAIASGVAAAALAAALVLPSTMGGDQAFATWTATPSGMSARDTARAAEVCRHTMKSAAPGHGKQLGAAKPVVAERRGKWTLVILAGQDGFSAQCIGDRLIGLFNDMTGSVGHTPAGSRPGARELAVVNLGTANMPRGDISLVSGLAGSEVAAVSYASASRGKVVATVSGGHFALWFPGNELGKKLETGQKKGFPVLVTFRDGTQRTIRVSL